MKIPHALKEALLLTISTLYIILFVYAAVSKLIDFEHFQVQIGRSPMLSAIAGPVAWAVPVTELLIAAMLCNALLRLAGLYAAFCLMVMFSVYIIIILNWSFYIPCSCGGILSEMGWGEHLAFNLIFVLLGGVAIHIHSSKERYINPLPIVSGKFIPKQVTRLVALLILTILSTVTMMVLYAFSEHGIHRNNAFLRRYPHHPAVQGKGLDITYNSYYIAGFAGPNFYLGNTSAPMHLLAIDTLLHAAQPQRIVLQGVDTFRFSSLQLRVGSPDFFVADGNLPAVFKGTTGTWTAQRVAKVTPQFSNYAVLENGSLATREINAALKKSVLGIFPTTSGARSYTAPELLEGQGNGIFDTDGMLCYNAELKQLIYVYFYRNVFIGITPDLKPLYHGHTIDTVSRAVVKVAREDKGRVESLATAPLIVNNYAYAAGRYLYIKSKRIGRYEEPAMLKEAAIVDVYDIVSHRYEFSFYLYHYKGEEVESFIVLGDLLIGLTAHHVVRYRLERTYFNFDPVP